MSRGKQLQPLPTDRYIHPMIRWIHQQVMERKITYEKLAAMSGIGANTIRYWRNNDSTPKITDLEAVVNALGGSIVIVRVEA